MKILFKILIPFFFINYSFSQEILRQYSSNKIFEKMTLYKDSTFFYKIYLTHHQFSSYEHKGIWKIKKDTLYISNKEIRVIPEMEPEWKVYERNDKYLLKKRKITPVFNDSLYRKRKLLLIK